MYILRGLPLCVQQMDRGEVSGMDDYISRLAAIEGINKLMEIHFDRKIVLKKARDVVEQLPPAQPEIIRCKDCKHWIPYDWMFSEVWQSKNIADYPEDEMGCDCCDMAMKADDFCSRAERIKGDTE